MLGIAPRIWFVFILGLRRREGEIAQDPNIAVIIIPELRLELSAEFIFLGDNP
jgi:hypothetical protein